jgi:hypothetical protein
LVQEYLLRQQAVVVVVHMMGTQPATFQPCQAAPAVVVVAQTLRQVAEALALQDKATLAVLVLALTHLGAAPEAAAALAQLVKTEQHPKAVTAALA